MKIVNFHFFYQYWSEWAANRFPMPSRLDKERVVVRFWLGLDLAKCRSKIVPTVKISDTRQFPFFWSILVRMGCKSISYAFSTRQRESRCPFLIWTWIGEMPVKNRPHCQNRVILVNFHFFDQYWSEWAANRFPMPSRLDKERVVVRFWLGLDLAKCRSKIVPTVKIRWKSSISIFLINPSGLQIDFLCLLD